MGKKKISSQDFLDLMDEQVVAPEKMAFNPSKKPSSASTKKAKTPETILLLGRYKLTPVQEELVQFALNKTPKFVINLVSSPVARTLLERAQATVERLIQRK
jgi:hypothetical protein